MSGNKCKHACLHRTTRGKPEIVRELDERGAQSDPFRHRADSGAVLLVQLVSIYGRAMPRVRRPDQEVRLETRRYHIRFQNEYLPLFYSTYYYK